MRAWQVTAVPRDADVRRDPLVSCPRTAQSAPPSQTLATPVRAPRIGGRKVERGRKASVGGNAEPSLDASLDCLLRAPELGQTWTARSLDSRIVTLSCRLRTSCSRLSASSTCFCATRAASFWKDPKAQVRRCVCKRGDPSGQSTHAPPWPLRPHWPRATFLPA